MEIDALVQPVRGLVPTSVLPALVRRRTERLWADPSYRAEQLAQMDFLLGCSSRADDVPELARRYAEQATLRAFLRWHPRAITRQPVRGAEWLTSRRDTGRPLILSFLHHHRYDGMFGSLARVGAELHVLCLAAALAPDAPVQIRQHIRVVRRGATPISTAGGTAAILEALRPGMTLAIASDVPGQTPVEFLGRRVLGSSGAARIAVEKNAPVVLVTAHRDDRQGSYLQVHPPLEPSAFPDHTALLAEMLRVHGQAVLAWPEALEAPRARWGVLDAERVTLPGIGTGSGSRLGSVPRCPTR